MTIINYLSEDHNNTFNLINLNKHRDNHDVRDVSDSESLLELLSNYEFDDSKVVILAHGGRTGISRNNRNLEQVEYSQLIDSINNGLGVNLELNLCAVCSSHHILNFITDDNTVLSSVCYSLNLMDSIDKAVHISSEGFDRVGLLHEDEDGNLIYGIKSGLNG